MIREDGIGVGDVAVMVETVVIAVVVTADVWKWTTKLINNDKYDAILATDRARKDVIPVEVMDVSRAKSVKVLECSAVISNLP